MTKFVLILLLLLLLPSLPIGEGRINIIDESPEGVDKWFQKLPQAKEKLTKLHFYLHDILSGKNPTAVQVAQRNVSNASPTTFGTVVVTDDPLTIGPQPDSQLIGRAQGLYSSVSQQETSLILAFNYVFTHGEYNGSSLSILGSDPILHKYREMPILGGTGVFRLARGIATANTYFFNTTSLDAVVEFNLVVLHYS